MTHITTEKMDQVTVIRFNRPEKMNALTREMYAGLTRALEDASGDFGVRAVVLSSEGDHFTSGNDIGDFMAAPPTAQDSDVARFLAALLNFPKPLIASVKGNAVGVGTTMLFHCDLVIAGEDAKFSLPFTSLGLVPEAGSTMLFPQLVGHQRAARYLFTGDSFDGREGIEMGVVTEVASTPEKRALEFAQQIAKQPPQAIINTKALMKASKHEAVSHVMAAEFQLFAMALQSEEAATAFMNFMSKKGK